MNNFLQRPNSTSAQGLSLRTTIHAIFIIITIYIITIFNFFGNILSFTHTHKKLRNSKVVRKYQSQVVRNTVKSFGEIQLTMFGKHNKRKKQMRNCVIYSWPTVDQLLDIWGKVCDDVSDAVCGNVCGDVWLCMTMYGVICYNICHNNVCGDVLCMWLCMAIYGSAIWEQQEKALYWVYRRKGGYGIYCNFQHPLFRHFLFFWKKSPWW